MDDVSRNDVAITVRMDVAEERERQVQRWGYEHDAHHEAFEWLGLIGLYAAQGRYVEAAALCVAAEEARRLAALTRQPATGGA